MVGGGEAGIVTFVRYGGAEALKELEQFVPADLDAREAIVSSLASTTAARRLSGVIQLVMPFAVGVHAQQAADIAGSLFYAIFGGFGAEIGLSQELDAIAFETLGISLSTALLDIGSLPEVIAVADAFSGRTGNLQQKLEEGAVRALVAQLRIEEAAARYDRIDRTDELDGLLEDWWFPGADDAQFDLRVLDRRSSEERRDAGARILAARWITVQPVAHRAQQAAVYATKLDEKERAHFDRYFAEMEEAVEVVRNEIVEGRSNSPYRLLNQQMFRYQESSRKLAKLNTFEVLGRLDARHQINRASVMLVDDDGDQPYSTAAKGVLAAIDWFSAHGDKANAVSAHYALGHLWLKLGRYADALASFREVFEALVIVARSRPTAAQQAWMIRQFPELHSHLVRVAIACGDYETAFWASEGMRGLALVKPSLPPTWPATPLAQRSWHYLSMYVDDFGVVTFLYTQEGTIRCHAATLSRSSLDELVSRFSPTEWAESKLRDRSSPRQKLSELLRPLGETITDGVVSDGDHIAVALDYPLHLVPVQYLDVSGRFAVERFTLSRVASFVDAAELAALDVRSRPRKSVALIVPASDNAAPHSHLDAAFRSISPLPAVEAHSHPHNTTASDFHRALTDFEIVHVQAHGYFPVAAVNQTVDSIRRSGLLLSKDGEFPDRSRPEKYLLSGSDVVAAASAAALHVSLAACVSGLGRPGVAGDMLGMEFALRMAGCGSVTASHWHVDLELAADFYQSYYKHWIEKGRTRAQAWRQATLDLLREAGHCELSRAHACAFSLYGAWN